MCGKVEENLSRTMIEGVELDVCGQCSKFGKVIAPVKRYSPKEQHKMIQISHPRAPKEEKIELLAENYPELVKKKRESMGLSQKDFALRINEKESTLHNIETGHFEPSMEMTRKLEKALGIKLIEMHDDEPLAAERKKKEGGFTLGDFIRVRK